MTETCRPLRSKIIDIAGYLPKKILDNEELAQLFPDWPADRIFSKTGIASRHIAAEDETAADLAFNAANNLFLKGRCKPEEIDFLILCTQAPDFILPTSACVLQHRLGIPTSAGALDINLGCSGFVYGLALAKSLIETGAATKVLLLTADTYSKFIHPLDKSVRTLFGDGAAATFISAIGDSESGSIGPFVFGTDGAGAHNLIVEAGGFRSPASPESAQAYPDDSGNTRSKQNLYMNGAEVMGFSLVEVPKAVDALLLKMGKSRDDIEYFVLHQANKFMLDALRKKLKIPSSKVPLYIENVGNTVSSTIPLALCELFDRGLIKPGSEHVLVGFGVGYSWAASAVSF
jgi:3-oxoacyl-[acyl-carrier-protein] synthase-3